MFTGIIEALGRVEKLTKDRENLNLVIHSNISNSLKIDQSLSHNGVCLTVVALGEQSHTVTAVGETLSKTNLRFLEKGSPVNLERGMSAGSRLDGHLVQGHVDETGEIVSIQEAGGSWLVSIRFNSENDRLLVPKGSICVDGVSLTIAHLETGLFTVAIIPYTWEHTIFHQYRPGTIINLEFDIIGKYLSRLAMPYLNRE